MVGFDTSDDAGVYRLADELCLIQTAVFVILSCVYIALHTAEAEEGHH